MATTTAATLPLTLPAAPVKIGDGGVVALGCGTSDPGVELTTGTSGTSGLGVGIGVGIGASSLSSGCSGTSGMTLGDAVLVLVGTTMVSMVVWLPVGFGGTVVKM